MDSGNGFPLPQLEEMKSALGSVSWRTCDALMVSQRLVKTAAELSAMRAAGRLLKTVCSEAERFIKPGRKEYEIVADIDRLARDQGAEDIRILTGETRLNPPSFKRSTLLGSHWAVYLAVQHERYWSEAGRTFMLEKEATLQSAYDKAQKVVAQMASELKPGGSVAGIGERPRRELGELYSRAAMYGLAHGIGLNQWEAPFINESDAQDVGAPTVGPTILAEHMTLALRAAFETKGKMIIFGDSFEITANGAKSLLAG
jgi:Xaa-Pro aminopeptidase